MAIAPDATRIAEIVTNGETRTILVKNLATGTVESSLVAGTAKVQDLVWAGRDHLIITASTTATVQNVTGPRREYRQAFDFDLRDGKLYPLLHDAKEAMTIITGAPFPHDVDGKPMVMLYGGSFTNGHGQGLLTLFDVDLNLHKTREVWVGRENANGVVVDATGAVLAFSEYNARTTRWTLKVKQGDAWSVVRSQDGLDPPTLLGVGRSAGSVIVSEVRADGTGASGDIPSRRPVGRTVRDR